MFYKIHRTVFTKRPRQWHNTAAGFGLRAQWLHAIIGCAVLIMLPLGLSLDSWPKDWQPYATILHKGLGLWILLGGVVWIVHRFWQKQPVPVPGETRATWRLAKFVHRALLSLCIIMPLSGWIMVSAWGDAYVIVAPTLHIPAITTTDPAFGKAMLGVHIVLAWVICGLLALHASGAIYHYFIKRDTVVQRMIPGYRPTGSSYRTQFDRGVRHTKTLR